MMDQLVARRVGRPTSYTPDMGKRICEAVVESGHGLKRTLEADPTLPTYWTVVNWLSVHLDLAKAIACAREYRLEAMSDELADIADDDTLDPADRRIRIDTRKWLLSKLRHKTFGDKLDVTSGGEALAAPSHQIDARVQSIIMQAQARKRAVVDGLDDEAQSLLE